MVFRVSKKYLQGQDINRIIDWMHGCLHNMHFVECDKECIDYIKDLIDSYASQGDKELILVRRDLFDAPEDLKARLTLVSAKGYKMNDLVVLSSAPAVLVLENIRELEVYKSIALAYCKDNTYGHLYKHLYRRMQSIDRLTVSQSGGYGDIPETIQFLDSNEYAGNVRLKSLSVFDRDTDSPVEYDEHKNHLFQLFLNKKSDELEESDIYSLRQQPFHWHMWYKRAIENYFPSEQFKKIGCTIRPNYDRTKPEDYIQIGNRYLHYNKNKVVKLPKGMSFSDYERRLHSFYVGGERLSEFQLFLFKIMQII